MSDKLIEKIEALSAQNELLMQASWELKEGNLEAFYKIKHLRNCEPIHCLDVLKASAARDGFLACIYKAIEINGLPDPTHADEYYEELVFGDGK